MIMAEEQEIKAREDAFKSLERLQNFDIKTLPRENALGKDMNFKAVVEPAEKLIGFYKQISLSSLDDLPQPQLDMIHSQANADYNRFEEILNFSQTESDAYTKRNAIIKKVDAAYQATFTKLFQLVSYSASKSADFQRLEIEGRAAIQTIDDLREELDTKLAATQKEAKQILKKIQDVAAEQGVSQQSHYFNTESSDHSTAANKWRTGVYWSAGLMLLYASSSLFIHKIPFLKPADTYDSIQLGISKMLIFAVISYMLYLSARNFLAHKHNAIVNKHRQNALMTYTALVEASGDDDNKEIILGHASSCIFSPQSTGYSRESGSGAPSAKSVVELLTKPFSASGE